jgi:DNA-binding transcriptional LysR family regulator
LLSSEAIRSIQVFVSVVEEQSFVGAARRLGITSSAVSKQVARLEERLGVRLLQRTTRSLSLTEEGLRYHRRCAAILGELEATDRDLASNDPNPRGLLRITAPTLLGQTFVASAVVEFLRLYPEVTIDLDLSDGLVDIVEASFDLAIRSGTQLPSSSLVAKKLAPHGLILCVSPEYLQEHGVPERPKDLERHHCLLRRGNARAEVWQLSGENGSCDITVNGRFYSNSRTVMFHAALAGCGIATLPRYFVDQALAEGKLVRVLPQHRLPDRFVYAVYAHRQPLSGKLRAFLDFISERAQAQLGTG